MTTSSLEFRELGVDNRPLTALLGSLEPTRSLKSLMNESYQKDTPEAFQLLRALMKMTRSRQSRDPRDHVYGLLGSCTLLVTISSTFRPPQVDYSRPCAELYGDIFRTFLLNPNDIGLDMRVTEVRGVNSSNGPGVPGLPSWIPDYSVPYPPLSFWYDRKFYNAGFHRRYPLQSSCFANNGTWLVLRGVEVDEVSVIPDPTSVLLCTMESELFQDLDKVISSVGEPPTTSESEILWVCRRTLCLDLAVRLGAMISEGEPISNLHGVRIERIGSNEAARAVFELAWTTQFPLQPQTPGDLTVGPAINLDEDGTPLSEMFVVMASGRTAMCRPYTLVGDIVVVFPGVCMPFILRQRQGCDRHQMIGPAYVDGIMDGEVIEAMERGEYELETFVID
ncbi:hypothetical protein TI39_contig285g00047 [Zymoseptoria brevis]|uniref:Heterokaryon incompatibility protein n=1 Tax=Zymoseptoria brevis TaxID=1047168 RepID=A0A0F4GW65_9PEZI|nr:hypothetical protein TI39_contig285g00047 [Zymoseptoria brevis]